MSDVPGKELAEFSAAQAAVEPYRAGGIIERAIGSPERNMDRIIGDHLGKVAMLNARGDTVQERPTYIFNPDSSLLINYAYRRDPNPDREGFFADIVELDEQGKPRHGVSIENPFATETGFINVAVGENDEGFAPSSVNLNFESDDPTSLVPPNIELADLLSMQQAEPIPDDMALDEFLVRQKESQQEMRGKVQARHNKQYLRTNQAMTPVTDADLHLIITDRVDSSAIEAASREVGVFPIILPADEVVATQIQMRKMGVPAEDFSRFGTFVALNRADTLRQTLASRVPAFVTVDYENDWPMSEESKLRKTVTLDNGSSAESWYVADIDLKGGFGGTGPLNTQPIFSRLSNYRWSVEPEFPRPVDKKAHGEYELPLDPSVTENLKTYTDWLRKARLDFALTLYLRGLNQF